SFALQPVRSSDTETPQCLSAHSLDTHPILEPSCFRQNKCRLQDTSFHSVREIVTGFLFQVEPVKPIGSQTQYIGTFTNHRKPRPAKELDGDSALEWSQIQVYRLRRSRQVMHEQQEISPMFTYMRQDSVVFRAQEGQRPSPKCRLLFSSRNHLPHPIEQRRRRLPLRFDVRHVEAIDGI